MNIFFKEWKAEDWKALLFLVAWIVVIGLFYSASVYWGIEDMEPGAPKLLAYFGLGALLNAPFLALCHHWVAAKAGDIPSYEGAWFFILKTMARIVVCNAIFMGIITLFGWAWMLVKIVFAIFGSIFV